MKKLLMAFAAGMTAAVTQTALAEVGPVVSAQNRVSIVASDASAGTVTLAFGGERSDCVLYIVRDDADKGAVPGAWANRR